MTRKKKEEDQDNWKRIPRGFVDGLKLCSQIIGKKNQLRELEAVAIRDKFMWASDNDRITRYELPTSMDDMNLPFKAVEILLKSSVEPNKYRLEPEDKAGSGTVHFTIGKSKMKFALLAVDYPVAKMEEIVKSYEGTETMYAFPNGFDEALDTSGCFASGTKDYELPSVLISRKENELIVQSEDAVGGANIPVSFTGEMFADGITIRVPPDFLKKILDTTRSFALDGNVMIFRSDAFRHLMTVKLEG